MAIKSLDDLRKIKERARQSTAARHENETQVIVGMGTCGIAAGARTVMTAILDEISRRGLRNVSVLQTGCIGMCQREPLVDIVRPGEPRVTYGNVKPEDVPRIINEHLVNGRILTDMVVAKI
ncbi:MAG: (2Fe-2S) ferredoxin domain-containing protein [Synergistaceae bacterium]|jgi:NADP-reducing hydrogenase subunit HndB|nr:(2Fe-2S) ferredoxin domain-containing protein [Synergistaceae bacterium]